MKICRLSLIGFVFLAPALASAQLGGLDQPGPIDRYLDGSLPSETPRPGSGGWTLVNAFPNLTFIDPVQMIPVPGTDQLLVVEKNGRLSVFENDSATSSKSVLFNLSSNVESSHDSGMMGAAFHPEFGEVGSPNRDYLYVFYRFTPNPAERNKGYCRLSRFTWRLGTPSIDTNSELVMINQYDRHNWHNGGGLFFGPDGFLYLSIGDEGGANDQYGSGQKINGGLLAGALRIDVDQDPNRSHPIRRQPRNPATPPSGWPDSYSQGYYIPNDNPWQSPSGSHLEEFWAIGLRSPHRMTQDPVTGRIWVGDVGQGSREEVSLVAKGANLQWPYREGDISGPKSKPSNLIGTDQPPVWAYGRGSGGCVIGGYVYRGSEHPDLYGKYIVGDHNNGKIRALTYSPGQAAQVEELVTLNRHGPGPKNGLGAFGIDADNEIYILSLAGTDQDGGIIYKFGRTSSGVPEPPSTLSATGAFDDLSSLTPRDGVIPYDLIQPLWSDGAEKKRWIAIPNDGTPNSSSEQIQFSENGPWTFPIGTVLIKHFEISGRRLETRFFVRGSDGTYFGFTYKWRADNSDADLLPSSPLDETIDLGGGQSIDWHFPGRTECFICHTEAAETVLGPKTRHLNREIFYPETGRTANQLVTLSELGFLSETVSQADTGSFLTSANVSDPTESLDRRARAYLDINCSQCHQPNGPTQATFDARFTVAPNFQNMINVDPTNPLNLPEPKLVEPGDVENSILHTRMNTLDGCCAMPPLAKNAVDAEAVAVVADWIRSLDPAISPTGPTNETPPADYSLPFLTLAHSSGDGNVTGSFDIAITTSEPILGLTAADFEMSNGVIATVAGSGTSWTATVIPSANGAGSITVLADRVTDLNGNANLAIATPLVFDAQLGGTGTNLLSNGGFENGFQNWDSGGSVSTTDQSHTGSTATDVGENSFVVQSIAIQPSQNFILSGFYTATASIEKLYAGVTFFDTNGNEVGDVFLLLPPSSSYSPFELELSSPANASVAAIYILTAGGGSATVDDLALVSGGNGGSPPDEDNLFPNGDFENDFSSWDASGGTSIVSDANTGQKAASVGAGSFVVFNSSTTPGEVLRFSGFYKSSGGSSSAEAGFSFRDSSGTSISDEYLTISGSGSYQTFEVVAEVPSNAAEVSVWVLGVSGSPILVDTLSLAVGGSPPPEPDDLLTNGGFESGDFSGWDTGGSNVTITNAARTGTSAAQFGQGSFVVHNQSAIAGTTFRMSGFYRTSGSGGIHEAGFIFWGSNGTILREEEIALPARTSYSPFEVVATAPTGTVSLSAWIYNGAGSTMFVDDMSLEATAGSTAKSISSKLSTRIGDLDLASETMLYILSSRDPNSYSVFGLNPVQPDLAIYHRTTDWIGYDIYHPLGLWQLAKVPSRRPRIRDKFNFVWQNDAVARYDSGRFYGTRRNRSFIVKYFEPGPQRINLTALVATGRYVSPRVAPGTGIAYQIRVRQRIQARRNAFLGRVTAVSVLDGTRGDTVQYRTWRR